MKLGAEAALWSLRADAHLSPHEQAEGGRARLTLSGRPHERAICLLLRLTELALCGKRNARCLGRRFALRAMRSGSDAGCSSGNLAPLGKAVSILRRVEGW